MKRLVILIKSQQGSAMVMALLIFLIVSVLATSVISVAAMENKITLYDARKEQARQLADAGVQVAKNVTMNYIGNGKLTNEAEKSNDIDYINDKLDDLESRNITAEITGFNFNSGIVTIKSTGTVKNPGGSHIKKTAKAEILVNAIPNYPLRSNRLKVMGKYFSTVSDKAVSLDGTFLAGLLNLQDWDPRDVDTINYLGVSTSRPLHGPSYDDPGFIDSNRNFFLAGNSNNLTNNYTWWVDYEYIYGQISGSKISHDIPNSKLHVAPFWKPYGIVNVIDQNNLPAEVGLSDDWDNDSTGFTGLFDNNLTNPIVILNYPLRTLKSSLTPERTHSPPKNLKSSDFMGKFTRIDTSQNVTFDEEQVSKYKEIAQGNPDWQYIAGDSSLLQMTGTNRYKLVIDDSGLSKTKFFIDLPSNNRIDLDFTTCATYTNPIFSWDPLGLNILINDILNRTGTFFNTFRNQLDSIIAVSPASLYVGLDSFMFEGINEPSGKKPYIYLLSSQDIDLLIDPVRFNGPARYWNNAGSEREIRTFILAGKDVRITSTPEKMTFRGIISASENMTFFLDYFDEYENMVPLREVEKEIFFIKDPDIVSEFPEPWAYIGKGPIISYKYID